MTETREKHPAPGKGRDAFIVHGHRLSSLYRGFMEHRIPFIVLKILKKSDQNYYACGVSISGTLKSRAAHA
jgi:hypothetical protein